MRFAFPAFVFCSALCIPAKANEESAPPLAPTGLTIVVCDSSNGVLDTIVVPEGEVSITYKITVPQDMVEIRAFAIGEERILGWLRENLTEKYCEVRTDEKGASKVGKLDARVKKGVFRGFVGATGLKPLTITDEMRDQIRRDIKEDKRSSIITEPSEGEQGGAGQPATAREPQPEGDSKRQAEAEGRSR